MEGGGDTRSQHGPSNSAVRNNFQTKNTHEQNDLEVVIGRDSPGGDKGLPARKLETGGN